MTSTVLINGVPGDGTIPVTDSSVFRGDGCFEVLRAYRGTPFALAEHLDRLQNSAARLEIDLPPREQIADWVRSVSAEEPDGAVRIVVTRGSAVPDENPSPLVIVFAHRWEASGDGVALVTVAAPWHSAGEDWSLAGAKVLSYAPNLAASRAARLAGGDDALLVTSDGRVLEGPTFSVGWVVGGVVETPSLDLGILDSITRRHVIALASQMDIEVVEGEWESSRLDVADEILAMSTIRQVQPVVRVDDRSFSAGPVTARLASGFAQLVG